MVASQVQLSVRFIVNLLSLWDLAMAEILLVQQLTLKNAFITYFSFIVYLP